jgi:hypothetical protein
MTAIVSIETVLLVLLIVLVAGLLRSHAEILRRLGRAEDEPDVVPAIPTSRRERISAPPLAGTTPAGDAVSLSFAGDGASPMLLAFLTTGCSTCAEFWDGLHEPRLPAGVQVVIVAHGADRESPAKLRRIAPPRVPVVMSSQAWKDYTVPAAPYFVLVDETIRGEGVATTWHALSSLVSDAIEDERDGGGNGRAQRIEETLAVSGITAGHPSLYPGGQN